MTRIDAAQQRYNRSYDKLLRRGTQVIKPDGWVHLRFERGDEARTRHKLASIADGTFWVKTVNTSSKTIDLEGHYNLAEIVLRSRLALASIPLDLIGLYNDTCSLTDDELETTILLDEPINMVNLTPALPRVNKQTLSKKKH